MNSSTFPKCLVYRNTRFEFNPQLIQYSAPKKTAHGGYCIQATYPINGTLSDGTSVQANAPIVLQTPVMQTSFGFSINDRDGSTKGGVDLTFNDDAPADVMAFKDVMDLWDRLLVTKAKSSKVEWFKSSKVSDDIIDYLYCKIVRENVRKSDGQKFADTLRPKIRRRSDQFVVDVFDIDGKPISIEEITPRSQIRALLSNSGIWLSDTLLVASFECAQIQQMASPELSGFAFVDDNAVKPGFTVNMSKEANNLMDSE